MRFTSLAIEVDIEIESDTDSNSDFIKQSDNLVVYKKLLHHILGISAA